MARTAGEVITSALVALTDPDQERADDPTMFGYIEDALNQVKTVRPDLFVGKFTAAIDITARSTVLPIGDQFFRPIVDYVIARVETQDDAQVNNARAELMYRISGSALA